MHRLTERLAVDLARMAIENVDREYPNAPNHLLISAADLRSPRELHPSFFGSWDWHSTRFAWPCVGARWPDRYAIGSKRAVK